MCVENIPLLTEEEAVWPNGNMNAVAKKKSQVPEI
jgi:hypothetical protein